MKTNTDSSFQTGLFIAALLAGPLVAERLAHNAPVFMRLSVDGCVCGAFVALAICIAENLPVHREVSRTFSARGVTPRRTGMLAAAMMLGPALVWVVASDLPLHERMAMAEGISAAAMFGVLGVATQFRKAAKVHSPRSSQAVPTDPALLWPVAPRKVTTARPTAVQAHRDCSAHLHRDTTWCPRGRDPVAPTRASVSLMARAPRPERAGAVEAGGVHERGRRMVLSFGRHKTRQPQRRWTPRLQTNRRRR
jgi:hypothetical protein